MADFPASVPQRGILVGGLLAGWNCAILAVVLVNGKPLLKTRCTPPGAWPFPQDVRFKPGDFDGIEVVAGDAPDRIWINERIKRLQEDQAPKNKASAV